MLKINIEIADKQLKELKEDISISGISYDGIKTSATNKTGDMTADAAVNNVSEEELILKRKEKLQNKLDTIGILIDGLNETEKKVIQKRYIEGLRWWEVAYHANYSEIHCKRIRKEAINKLITGVYGDESIK